MKSKYVLSLFSSLSHTGRSATRIFLLYPSRFLTLFSCNALISFLHSLLLWPAPCPIVFYSYFTHIPDYPVSQHVHDVSICSLLFFRLRSLLLNFVWYVRFCNSIQSCHTTRPWNSNTHCSNLIVTKKSYGRVKPKFSQHLKFVNAIELLCKHAWLIFVWWKFEQNL